MSRLNLILPAGVHVIPLLHLMDQLCTSCCIAAHRWVHGTRLGLSHADLSLSLGLRLSLCLDLCRV